MSMRATHPVPHGEVERVRGNDLSAIRAPRSRILGFDPGCRIFGCHFLKGRQAAQRYWHSAASRRGSEATEAIDRCNAGMGVPFRFLGDPGKAEIMRGGTCTRGLRICNAERVTLTNSASSPRVCLCP
jgi:hypothetical protein